MRRAVGRRGGNVRRAGDEWASVEEARRRWGRGASVLGEDGRAAARRLALTELDLAPIGVGATGDPQQHRDSSSTPPKDRTSAER